MLKNQIVAPFHMAANTLIWIEKMIIAVLNSILKIFGMKQMPMPSRQIPQLSIRPDDILSEVGKDGSEVGLATSEKLLKPTTDAGHTLYRYACAQSPSERSTIDLSALTDDQQYWLYQLSDADLSRLSKAGLDACTRAMDGKRCGVGGLPKFVKQEPAEATRKTSPLAERIHAYRLNPAFA
ncbi:hypothetical protein [Ochrobactrum chromiisoli]|uniref:Uncharacterized protein n=1 Tax=Ochrobactrum chromiisoli TaxID=2993941 RepID=A0ABT3QKW7_9HYPH|nr:hypothetical protein [Ochrobactrum chromiisoli]MCX2696262.1 hypothetical protein [Ochrobactrum chromiisoli]